MSNGLLKFTNSPIARAFPGLSIGSYTAGTFLKAGLNSKSIWEFIDYPFLTIPNYNKTMYNIFGNTLAPYAEGLIDFAVGIDEKGQMSIGQLVINILSVTGIGFIGKIGGKLSKLLVKNKYWNIFHPLYKFQSYYKNISYALEWFNDGVLLLTKFNTGVVSTLYSFGKIVPKLKNFNPSKSRIIKKILKNRTVKKLVNKINKSKTFKAITKKFNSLKNNIKKN